MVMIEKAKSYRQTPYRPKSLTRGITVVTGKVSQVQLAEAVDRAKEIKEVSNHLTREGQDLQYFSRNVRGNG